MGSRPACQGRWPAAGGRTRAGAEWCGRLHCSNDVGGVGADVAAVVVDVDVAVVAGVAVVGVVVEVAVVAWVGEHLAMRGVPGVYGNQCC